MTRLLPFLLAYSLLPASSTAAPLPPPAFERQVRSLLVADDFKAALPKILALGDKAHPIFATVLKDQKAKPLELIRLFEALARAKVKKPALLDLGQAAAPQVGVEGIEVSGLWHRRAPPPVQHAHARPGAVLLVAASGHAEERLEGVVAGQRGVAGVGAALPAVQDLLDEGGGFVLPHLARHAAEEGERLGHASEDGLGAFGGQGQGEGVGGVRLGGDQHGYLGRRYWSSPAPAWRLRTDPTRDERTGRQAETPVLCQRQ